MLYIKRFTEQDVRSSGGGANTLIAGVAVPAVFHEPLRPPGENIKIYAGGNEWTVNYGYSHNDSGDNEKRLKNFKQVLDNFEIAVRDIGIFKKRPSETKAYDVIFIKSSDSRFHFFDTLLSSNGVGRNRGHIVEGVVVNEDEASYGSNLRIQAPRNWLVAGAPGTGKSHFLEERSAVFGTRKSRVTFYPDYSYAKFVGSFRPSVYYKNLSSGGITFHENKVTADAHPVGIRNEPVIDYSFVPGPFLNALIAALQNEDPYLLIIEELNRANAPAVFGEVFQLLDRDAAGKSKYSVQLSDDAMQLVKENLGARGNIIDEGLFIPGNLYIWATANNADQGVFPLDTAFKRRWQQKYMSLEENRSAADSYNIIFGGEAFRWNAFRIGVNRFLSSDACKVSEDRLLAPFFIAREDFDRLSSSSPDYSSRSNEEKNIAEKVLMYLKDDVLRHNHRKFFEVGINTMHDIETKGYRLSEILKAEVLSLIREEQAKYDIASAPDAQPSSNEGAGMEETFSDAIPNTEAGVNQ